MSRFRTRLIGCASLLLGAVLGQTNVAHAAPTSWVLEHSEHPLLVEARKYDLYYVPPEQADQRKAEELYLKFIRENPDHELIPYLYDHLGHMYTDRANSDWAEPFGIVKDYAKAGRYHAEAFRRHPKDKFSGLLMGSGISAAALAGDGKPEPVVNAYIEYYRWLDGVTQEQIRETLWLNDHEKKLAEQAPRRLDDWITALWENRRRMLEVAEGHMLSFASHAKEDSLKLLRRIAEQLPDTSPGRKARAEIARREQLARQQAPKPPERAPASAAAVAESGPKPARRNAPAHKDAAVDDGRSAVSPRDVLLWVAAGGMTVALGVFVARYRRLGRS